MKKNGNQLVVQKTSESAEWPEDVKRAFLRLVAVADSCEFSIICAVGFSRARAKEGENHLSTQLSPRASTNPHRAELCADIAELFAMIAERSKQ